MLLFCWYIVSYDIWYYISHIALHKYLYKTIHKYHHSIQHDTMTYSDAYVGHYLESGIYKD